MCTGENKSFKLIFFQKKVEHNLYTSVGSCNVLNHMKFSTEFICVEYVNEEYRKRII